MPASFSGIVSSYADNMMQIQPISGFDGTPEGTTGHMDYAKENIMKTKDGKQQKPLPAAGPRKRNPKELEKILDKSLEDSMAVSDPITAVMPEVKKAEEHR
jgi:hypothetical protein